MKSRTFYLILLLSIITYLFFNFSQTAGMKEKFNSSEEISIQENAADKVVEVSMVQLLANPEKYHDKEVAVVGVARIEFEGNAIFLHREDYEHRISKNALAISVSEEIRKDKEKYNGKYVLLSGTFDAKYQGHMGANSGGIRKISVFRLWFFP